VRDAVADRGTVRSEIVTTWLNASFEMRFRLIGGLTVRFAADRDHTDHALLLSPWPESLLAFVPTWWRLAERTHLVAVDLPDRAGSPGGRADGTPGRAARRDGAVPRYR